MDWPSFFRGAFVTLVVSAGCFWCWFHFTKPADPRSRAANLLSGKR